MKTNESKPESKNIGTDHISFRYKNSTGFVLALLWKTRKVGLGLGLGLELGLGLILILYGERTYDKGEVLHYTSPSAKLDAVVLKHADCGLLSTNKTCSDMMMQPRLSGKQTTGDRPLEFGAREDSPLQYVHLNCIDPD